MGKKCFFNQNTMISCIESITIGDGKQIGNNVTIIDHDYNYKNYIKDNKPLISSPIKIGDNVWIGADAIILRGSKIGNNVVIAAGTIVKGEIPDDSLVYQERNTIVKKIGENHAFMRN